MSTQDPFDPCYEQFSHAVDETFVPAHFNYFLPDYKSEADFSCLCLLQPAPEKGATKWILQNKRILIGVYRDEGRAPTRKPPQSMTWELTGNILTITTAVKHKLRTGDAVELLGLEPPLIPCVVIVVDAVTVKTIVPITPLVRIGTGLISRIAPLNFFEERVVYRYLPSMRLVPVQEILDLFYDTAPVRLVKTAYKATGEADTLSYIKTVGDNGYKGSSQVVHKQQFINLDVTEIRVLVIEPTPEPTDEV